MIAAAVAQALSTLQSAVSAAGTLQNASPTVLAPVAAAATAALAAIDDQAAILEQMIDQETFGGVAVGMDIASMVATFVDQAQDALDLSTLQTARGYVARIAANIGNAGAVTPAVITAP